MFYSSTVLEKNMDKEYAKCLVEKTRNDYDKIAKQFSDVRKNVYQETVDLIKKYIKRGDRILDLGCGNGRLYSTIVSEKIDYAGIDFSEELIKIAQKKYPEGDFMVGDILNLPFPDDHFDKIYSIAVLHHIPSKKLRLQGMREIRRVLKPEGFLVLTVWNLRERKNIKKLIYKFILLKFLNKSKLDFGDILKKWKGVNNCYFHCFKKRELESLAKKAELRTVDSGEIFINNKKSQSNFYIVAKNSKES